MDIRPVVGGLGISILTTAERFDERSRPRKRIGLLPIVTSYQTSHQKFAADFALRAARPCSSNLRLVRMLMPNPPTTGEYP